MSFPRATCAAMVGARSIRAAPMLLVPRPVFRPLAIAPILQRYYADRIIQVPQMAESISEGTLSQWTKRVGDKVAVDEEVANIETDKIDVAVNAPAAGILKELFVNEQDTVTVGQNLARLELTEDAPEEASAPRQEPAPAPSRSEPKPPPLETASPVPTNAPEAPKPAAYTPQPPPPSPPAPAPPAPTRSSTPVGPKADAPGHRQEHRVKMNRMRLRIGERLKESQNTAASLTTFNEVDMSALVEFRNSYKEAVLGETGVKLGFVSAFTLASVKAMREFPVINASIEGEDTIVYRDYVDVSIAVATEKGLVTPVVRNVESMDMIGIEKAIAEMGRKARDGSITIEDMAGGTFTISNGGVFGSLMGTPIINLPQSAVLGLHAIKDRVVAVKGKPEVRPMMYLALTYDHRLLDGREAVQFLIRVKQYIEDPRKMLL